MELKDINENYKKSQIKVSKLGPAKAKVENLKKEIIPLVRKIEDLETVKRRAQEDKDEANVQKADKDLKAIKLELNSKKELLQKIESMILKTEAELDNHIKLLEDMEKDNPQLFEHMNEVIAKKFSRKVIALENEKKNLNSTNDQLSIIQNAAKKDPYIMNTLKGIEGYTKSIEQLSNSNDINDINKLNEAKRKLAARRNDLKIYFKDKISDEVINSLTSFNNISKSINSNNRQIKGINKNVSNYKTALNELGYTIDIPNGKTITDLSGKKILSSQIKDYNENEKILPPAEKPKWYQFIKRFKNWYNSKNIEPKQEIKSKQSSNNFKDSMKYDIIRDYESKLEKDLLQDAKAINKESRVNSGKEEESR